MAITNINDEVSKNTSPNVCNLKISNSLKPMVLVELGYVSLDVQYIDETKIESASNRYVGNIIKQNERGSYGQWSIKTLIQRSNQY